MKRSRWESITVPVNSFSIFGSSHNHRSTMSWRAIRPSRSRCSCFWRRCGDWPGLCGVGWSWGRCTFWHLDQICGVYLKLWIFCQPTDDPPSPSLWLFHVLTQHGRSPGVQDGRFEGRVEKKIFQLNKKTLNFNTEFCINPLVRRFKGSRFWTLYFPKSIYQNFV